MKNKLAYNIHISVIIPSGKINKIILESISKKYTFIIGKYDEP
jgi:hypothetical protein